jgi:hypothetical protein
VRTAIAYQDVVAPELLDTITGPDEASIIAAAERAKATSQRLVQRVLQEQVRPSDIDPAWQFNQAQGYGDQGVPDVSGMSMEEFAAARAQLGLERPKDQGIFAGVRKG